MILNTHTSQTILMDADDTLWHNNIFYEKAFAQFFDLMQKHGFDSSDIETQLREKEIENVEPYGYGSQNVIVTMRQVYDENMRIKGHAPTGADHAFIEHIGLSTRNYPIELLQGVADTLPRLARDHTVIAVTKGVQDEQMDKLRRSGLMPHFKDIVVVYDKTEEVYRRLMSDLSIEITHTWMVGNSPRSDINPAKAIGLKTVLIPYIDTWTHEVEPITDTGHPPIILKDFSELSRVFKLTPSDELTPPS